MITTAKNHKTGYVPLLPKHNIYLLNIHSDDADRFVQLFQQVWQAIPKPDQQRLLNQWRKKTAETGGMIPYPIIKLTNNSLDFISNLSLNFTGTQVVGIGNYDHYRCTYQFHADSMKFHSDIVVRYIIAHEIAHTIGRIDAEWSRHGEAMSDEDWTILQESIADGIATKWGFDTKEARMIFDIGYNYRITKRKQALQLKIVTDLHIIECEMNTVRNTIYRVMNRISDILEVHKKTATDDGLNA